MDEHINRIKEAVVMGNRAEIEDFVRQALQNGVNIQDVINNALISAMDIVGQKYTDREIFIPEMMIAANAMKMGLDVIKPMMTDEQVASKGTILIGTVRGDVHDVGKNLVAMMLEGSGFHVIDLGVDVREEKIFQHIKENSPDLLAMSALLTTTMPQMKNVIDALTQAGYRDAVKVIIGGAPVDKAYAEKIGADGYADDASEAVQLARKLIPDG